MAQHQTYKKQR